MKYIYICLGWFFGLSFLLAGFGSLLTSPMASLSIIIAALLIFPPARDFSFSKTGININPKFRAILVMILLATFSGLTEYSEKRQEVALAERKKLEVVRKSEEEKQARISYFSENRERILSELDVKFKDKNYASVISVAKNYLDSNDEQLVSLYKKATSRWKQIKNEQREQELLIEAKYVPASNISYNAKIYKELKSIRPDNEEYIDKHAFYSNKVRVEHQKKQAERAKKMKEKQLANARRNKIEAQFSAWDGSHRNLSNYIKRIMNDPKSYDHAETRYADKGDYLIVQTTFRGKNAFGGVVLQTVQAKVDLDGNILQILN